MRIAKALLALLLLLCCAFCACEKKGGKDNTEPATETVATEPEQFLRINRYRAARDFDPYAGIPAPAGDYEAALAAYVETDAATPQLCEAYGRADEIRFLPVRTTEMQPLPFVTACLYDGGEMIDAIVLYATENDGTLQVAEIQKAGLDLLNGYATGSALNTLRSCAEEEPDFEILGFRSDYANMICLYGKADGSDRLQLYGPYGVGILDLPMCPDAATADEARAAYVACRASKEAWLTSIHAFDWEGVEYQRETYLRIYTDYSTACLDDAEQREELLRIKDCDDMITVPLLAADGSENRYVLELLFCNGVLYGELLLRYDPNEQQTPVTCVYARLGDVDPDTGALLPLSSIKYIEETNALLANLNKATVKGVAYDGQAYFLIMK